MGPLVPRPGKCPAGRQAPDSATGYLHYIRFPIFVNTTPDGERGTDGTGFTGEGAIFLQAAGRERAGGQNPQKEGIHEESTGKIFRL